MNYNSVHSKVLRPLSQLFRDDLDVYSDCVEHFIFLHIEIYVYVFSEINRIMYIFHDPAKKTKNNAIPIKHVIDQIFQTVFNEHEAFYYTGAYER